MDTLSELIYFCNIEEPAGAILLTGEWGCGKTYLIEHDLRDALKESHLILRVSLFGLPDISSIHLAVKKALLNEKGGFLNKAENAKQPISTITQVASQIPGVKEIAKAAGGILSVNLLDFVKIEKRINGKKVILVFDDLERSNLSTTDILGAINGYCENEKMNVIIVADESKISSEDEKFLYQVLKEKIVQRTIQHSPDYNKIVTAVVDAVGKGNKEYQGFLREHTSKLQSLFSGFGGQDISDEMEERVNTSLTHIPESDERKKERERIRALLKKRPHNIRSLKAALQDFERLFNMLSKTKSTDVEKWLFTFVAATLASKAGVFKPDQEYDHLLQKSAMACLFPGFYSSTYMPKCIYTWISSGLWNEEEIANYIDELLEKQNYKESPYDLVRTCRFDFLEIDTIKAGFPELLENAYKGELSLDDYITVITNSLIARHYSFQLPEEINWGEFKKGIAIKRKKIMDSDDEDATCHITISGDSFIELTPDEQEAYNMIQTENSRNDIMFQRNERLYINLMSKSYDEAFRICKDKRFNSFTEKMANATADAFKHSSNHGKAEFIGYFKGLLIGIIFSPDFVENDNAYKGSGFEILKKILSGFLAEYDSDPFAKKHTQTMLDFLEGV